MSRSFRVIVAMGLICGLALVAAPASAEVDGRVGAKTSKFCKAVQNLDVGELSDDPTEREQAAAHAKALRKAAKKAKGKLRKATRTVASAYDRLADGDEVRDIATVEYGKAFAVFSTAVLKCVLGSTNIPDVSLPDVDLPDISLPDISLPER